MTTEDERCAEARKFQRLHDAFKQGDLDALRAAVDDPLNKASAPAGHFRAVASLPRTVQEEWFRPRTESQVK